MSHCWDLRGSATFGSLSKVAFLWVGQLRAVVAKTKEPLMILAGGLVVVDACGQALSFTGAGLVLRGTLL